MRFEKRGAAWYYMIDCCPWCEGKHWHVVGYRKERPVLDPMGHYLFHCMAGDAPYPQYELMEVSDDG